MTTGERIKEARQAMGMTQAQLAKQLEIPYQSIGQWERDLRNPKYSSLAKIASVLHVSAAYLAGYSPYMTDTEWRSALESLDRDKMRIQMSLHLIEQELSAFRREFEKNKRALSQALNALEYFNTHSSQPDRFQIADLTEKIQSMNTDALQKETEFNNKLDTLQQKLSETVRAYENLYEEEKIARNKIEQQISYEYHVSQEKKQSQIRSINMLFEQLNEQGQQKALESIEEIRQNPKYQKETFYEED